MMNFITKRHKLIFVTGAAVGVTVVNLFKTKKARELAVKGVAGGIMIKDKVLETAVSIKEEADDIVSEAKTTAKHNCNCKDDCYEN